MPDEVFDIVSDVTKHIGGEKLGIHTHNDTENAVANSLAAINAGVRQVQGTINGLGERCGNANLVSLIPTLLLKPGYAERFETGIASTSCRKSKTCRSCLMIFSIARRTDTRPMSAHLPLPIRAVHVSAVMKDPSTYEHVKPEECGQ